MAGRNDDNAKDEAASSSSGVRYFNNAAKARFDPDVVTTGVACVQQDAWEMSGDEDKERVRELFAQIIGAEGSEIAVMPSTAFAITLAAQNLKETAALKNRQGKILLLQDQYPSAVYPWQDLSQSSSLISLEIVPYPNLEEKQTWTTLILERLAKSDILVACLPPLSWCDGSIIDLNTIGAYCKERNIVLIVDATQAVGVFPVNVQAIQPAMLACSTHKWLRGPAGTCLCYVDKKAVSLWKGPLDQHDRARDWHGQSIAYRNTLSPNGYPSDFMAGARKFDSGGRAQPILMPMLRAALEKVALIDVKQAQVQLHALMRPLRNWIATQNAAFHPLPGNPETHAGHIFGLRPKQLSVDEMIQMAKQLATKERVIVSVRCGVFRVSPYVDNSAEDVQHLVGALQKVCSARRS